MHHVCCSFIFSSSILYHLEKILNNITNIMNEKYEFLNVKYLANIEQKLQRLNAWIIIIH